MMNILNVFKGVVQPLAGYMSKRQETKQLKNAASAKLQAKAIDATTQLEMSDREWELAGQKMKDDTWVDEYLTIIITAPVALITIGGAVEMFFPSLPAIETSFKIIQALEAINLNSGYGQVLLATVFAGLCLKWKKNT